MSHSRLRSGYAPLAAPGDAPPEPHGAGGVLRVLHVEDSEADEVLVVRALRAGGRALHYERIETEEEMRAAIRRHTWDVILSDWALPAFSAPAALGVVQEFALDVPFLIVSGTIGEEKAADAMRAGANDYISKERLRRLLPAVERELRERVERAERRRAEAALRKSEARFRRLAESGLVGIFVTGPNGEIREANDAFLSTVGYTRADLEAGMVNWMRLVPPEWATQNADMIEQIRTRGVAPPWETRYRRTDGTLVPVLSGIAQLDEDERISISIDLTSQKEAEEGKQRAEAALRLSEAQFRQAQRMEAVGRLAGGVAHDFNNVLSVILSYAELLRSDFSEDDPRLESVAEIAKAARRAAGLTQQLLTFSRQQVVEPRVLDLGEALTGLENMMRRLLGEDIDLRLERGAVGSVSADPTHFEQVLMNLVVNARDAMPTGGTLTIETADVELAADATETLIPAKPGPYVMLSVTDTGVGIDAATQSRMFEPFYTTKDQGKGTGLGLSTVFGIVQQSGGTIGVRSQLGEGTTIRIYLPRVSATPDVRRSVPPPTELHGSETILIVEDEEQVRAVARRVLSQHGYRILVARNPAEALALAATPRGAIDLLLTDVVMPQMSGPELARRLVATWPRLKVLCMSGYTDDAMIRHGVAELGAAFLQKPFLPGTLATKVREVLDQEPPSRPALA